MPITKIILYAKNIAIFIIMQKGRKLIWYQAAKLYISLLIENIFEIILFYSSTERRDLKG